ncbi:unnamed protein product [Cunninghamella blakesleeana]
MYAYSNGISVWEAHDIATKKNNADAGHNSVIGNFEGTATIVVKQLENLVEPFTSDFFKMKIALIFGYNLAAPYAKISHTLEATNEDKWHTCEAYDNQTLLRNYQVIMNGKIKSKKSDKCYTQSVSVSGLQYGIFKDEWKSKSLSCA